MIIQEIVTINNRQLRHTYSSENKYIKQTQTDAVYNEAYDTLQSNYTYTELEKEIEEETPIKDVPQE